MGEHEHFCPIRKVLSTHFVFTFQNGGYDCCCDSEVVVMLPFYRRLSFLIWFIWSDSKIKHYVSDRAYIYTWSPTEMERGTKRNRPLVSTMWNPGTTGYITVDIKHWVNLPARDRITRKYNFDIVLSITNNVHWRSQYEWQFTSILHIEDHNINDNLLQSYTLKITVWMTIWFSLTHWRSQYEWQFGSVFYMYIPILIEI